MNQLRRIWSLNKRRYQKDGYDLDLTYVTENVVAMCYPSIDFEALIRNPRDQVLKFFNQYHKDGYKVYNLCSEPEHQYDPKVFDGRVGCFQFADHQAPKFELIESFCLDLDAFFAQKPKNAAFIHCKAGKGRTGLMICCYLIWNKKMSADDAMIFYGKARTMDGKGVTIPSQRRYVQYFYEYQMYRNPSQLLQLKMIRLTPFDQTSLQLIIENYKHETIFDGSRTVDKKNITTIARTNTGVELHFDGATKVLLQDDLRMSIFRLKKGKKPKKLMHAWLNTRFITSSVTTLTKEQIDGPHKDRKKHKKYAKNFCMEVTFEPANGASFFVPQPVSQNSTATQVQQEEQVLPLVQQEQQQQVQEPPAQQEEPPVQHEEPVQQESNHKQQEEPTQQPSASNDNKVQLQSQQAQQAEENLVA